MIPTQPFGNTGHDSTRIIFGAAAFSSVSQDDADRTLALLEERGINHFDTAASYGDSELRLGPWLEHNRDKVFLGTKTGERKSQDAYDEIRRSLERLRVDQVDLIQFGFAEFPRVASRVGHDLVILIQLGVRGGREGTERAVYPVVERDQIDQGEGRGVPRGLLRTF